MSTVRAKKSTTKKVTHEGAIAKSISKEQELRRTLMSCLLWEDTFYESGEDIANRIADLVQCVNSTTVADMMIEARSKMNLRHAPLLVACALAKKGELKANDVVATIQRADELAEILALYWKDGKKALSNQLKKGIAQAFTKFDAYSLKKYNNQTRKPTLRDVLFMVHAKPKDDKQAALWKQLVDNTLPPAETWEERLSSGEDKKKVWESLLKSDDLGALAIIRNLRNMENVGVDRDLIKTSLAKMDTSRVLPFRFIAAARYAPSLEGAIEQSMFKSTKSLPVIKGKTAVLVDVSGSMDGALSSKSDMNRIDAACGLAIIAREMCEDCRVFSFSERIKEIPARRGFALRDAIDNSQTHGCTNLGEAVDYLNKMGFDRIIVVTDEQSHDLVSAPSCKGYMINVASYQNGVGYGKWIHIDGFSESIFRYIAEIEAL